MLLRLRQGHIFDDHITSPAPACFSPASENSGAALVHRVCVPATK